MNTPEPTALFKILSVLLEELNLPLKKSKNAKIGPFDEHVNLYQGESTFNPVVHFVDKAKEINFYADNNGTITVNASIRRGYEHVKPKPSGVSTFDQISGYGRIDLKHPSGIEFLKMRLLAYRDVKPAALKMQVDNQVYLIMEPTAATVQMQPLEANSDRMYALLRKFKQAKETMIEPDPNGRWLYGLADRGFHMPHEHVFHGTELLIHPGAGRIFKRVSYADLDESRGKVKGKKNRKPGITVTRSGKEFKVYIEKDFGKLHRPIINEARAYEIAKSEPSGS